MREQTGEQACDSDGRVGSDPAVAGSGAAGSGAAGPTGDDGTIRPEQAADAGLPLRSAPDARFRRAIRRLDDPEILERVLAGLLDLA